MEHQQTISYQLDMFIEQKRKDICHSENCKGVSGAIARKAKQVSREGTQGRAFTSDLMGIVCSSNNLKQAYKQVKRNKGVSGIDQMSVEKFPSWYQHHGDDLIDKLLRGSYHPQAVRQVEIPKPKGGVRKLGIPTVTDRVIQQAISQVLSPLYEAEFSSKSYGFRPKRSASMALCQASEYVKDGRDVVVDMDLQSFFDEVNHDRLMYRLSRKIEDKLFLRLIRRYLRCGILKGGLISQRQKGTPQGSPLSPLLSNIVLDELDKELEKRGHCFVRYADDFSIYVRSVVAGKRVQESISIYIEDKLKLKVNTVKSKVCFINETTFLGYTILRDGNLIISQENVSRFKMKVRAITKRNRGRSLPSIISELNPLMRGWLQYFRNAKSKSMLRDIDGWVRRKLRCYRLKELKRTISVKRFLVKQGVTQRRSWALAKSGKGLWRKSCSTQLHKAMNLKWFDEHGLYNMSLNYEMLTG